MVQLHLSSPTSLPTGMPLPRAAVRPMTLAIKALRVKYSFSTTPLRMVFSSGIPEPETEGETEIVQRGERRTKMSKKNPKRGPVDAGATVQ